MMNIKLMHRCQIIFLLFILQNTVSALEYQWIRGIENISINRYSTAAPKISDEVIFEEKIKYQCQSYFKSGYTVESHVNRLFMDRRRIIARNGYFAKKIDSKYRGDSGIDGLFLVKKNNSRPPWFLVAIEAKYSSTHRGFSFKSAIQHKDESARQMSLAWIRIVCNILCEKKTKMDPLYATYDFIKRNPHHVIRAIATADKYGCFKISLLKGYKYARRDMNLLQNMFQISST